MTLFWHNHFATDYDKIAGTFGVAKGARSDGGTTFQPQPPVKFGREIVELFTFGVDNYAEADVSAAARVFTGRNLQRLGANGDPAQHYEGRVQHESERNRPEDLQLRHLSGLRHDVLPRTQRWPFASFLRSSS